MAKMTPVESSETTNPGGETLASNSRCLRVIQAEFREMPGLALTKSQVERLWNLPSGMAESLLAELVGSGVLRRNNQGRYVLADFSWN